MFFVGMLVQTTQAQVHTFGTNWAQVNGPKLQKITEPMRLGFSRRWGHVLLNVNDEELFVFGGDDYHPEEGAGGFRNDVWRSRGVSWQIVEGIVDKRPKLVSKMAWNQVAAQKYPPQGATYSEWLNCFARRWSGLATCK